MGYHDKDYAEPHKEYINKYKMAHMHSVAEYMYDRAEAYGLDPEVMYTVGLLHDIGYIAGRQGHEEYGAGILATMGMTEGSEIVFAIEHHGENPYEVQEKYGADKMSNTLVLFLEADMSVDKAGYRVGFEQRISDIAHRYGTAELAEQIVAYIQEQWKEREIEPAPDSWKGYFKNNHNLGRFSKPRE